jgi:hypothetical protein
MRRGDWRMQELGRLLLVVAAMLAVVGVALVVAGKLGLGHLPGDVVVRGRHVTVYVPFVTSILLSLLLTGLLWLISGGKR